MSPQEQFDKDMQAAMDEITAKNPLPPPPAADADTASILAQAHEWLDNAKGFIVLSWERAHDTEKGEGVQLRGVINATPEAAVGMLDNLFTNHPELAKGLALQSLLRMMMGDHGEGDEDGPDQGSK